MDKKEKLLKKYIENSKNILIISHLGPDPDAFCSMLLLKEALRQIYPKKNIKVKTKQMPDFNIPTMKDLEIVERLEKGEEDFIIITDIPALSICTDENDSLRDTDVPIMIIDHHPDGKQSNLEITINELRSSATEQVYVTTKRIFGKRLRITKEMAEIAQYGIVSDTSSFMYETTSSDTMRIFADLMDISQIDMEDFFYSSQKFPRESIPFLIEFLRNTKIDDDMAYTFSNDTEEENKNGFKRGYEVFH
jgi:phosphoesterase RecJ-like protein